VKRKLLIYIYIYIYILFEFTEIKSSLHILSVSTGYGQQPARQ
jgi:hypothetical protein